MADSLKRRKRIDVRRLLYDNYVVNCLSCIHVRFSGFCTTGLFATGDAFSREPNLSLNCGLSDQSLPCCYFSPGPTQRESPGEISREGKESRQLLVVRSEATDDRKFAKLNGLFAPAGDLAASPEPRQLAEFDLSLHPSKKESW